MRLYSYYQKRNTNQSSNNGEWENRTINDSLLYSHRNTFYHAKSFPSNLHYHDYYELTVIEQGSIRYICESHVYRPQKGDIILIPPGKFHMSVIDGETTQYDRHVFYFYPSAFDGYDGGCLCDFALNEKNGAMLSLSDSQKQKTIDLLNLISSALSHSDSPLEHTLGVSYILQLFYLFNQGDKPTEKHLQPLPDNILQLKNYIDEHYKTIRSVSEVAKQFYYSREHASRLFKKHFDITLSDYILQRRILEGQKMISNGLSITDTALSVGFNSMSAFIRGFREINGITPSEYKKSSLCTR